MVIWAMDTHDNDNFDPWTSLGLATAMVLNRLHCQAQLLELETDSPDKGVESDNPKSDSPDETKKEVHRRFVETRLRELAAFERGFKRVK